MELKIEQQQIDNIINVQCNMSCETRNTIKSDVFHVMSSSMEHWTNSPECMQYHWCPNIANMQLKRNSRNICFNIVRDVYPTSICLLSSGYMVCWQHSNSTNNAVNLIVWPISVRNGTITRAYCLEYSEYQQESTYTLTYSKCKFMLYEKCKWSNVR